MKAAGVVVEYNPFHNGHLYHLNATREMSQADVVIAVMSGNFLQRGEPALVSKWARTKMALMNGADLVFELPYQFSTQKAEVFANGAIKILDAVGCSTLCFGSESGDAESFTATVNFLEQRRTIYDSLIRNHIKTGVSYPKAASLALDELKAPHGTISLSEPNNILGYHYVKSIQSLGSKIEPLTVKRKSANYHDEDFASSTIASATSIRKSLFTRSGGLDSIKQYIPDGTMQSLEEYLADFLQFHSWDMYWPFLKYRLIQSSPDELNSIYEAEEGLEKRLAAVALKAESFFEFMEAVKTKRYTWTRIQRLCTHILVNAKKEEMPNTEDSPEYMRLLGMSRLGKLYLNRNKGHFTLPVVSKLSAFSGIGIELDKRASYIYALGLAGSKSQKLLEMEYSQPPLFIEKR
ncbi:nucleotidyltransferase [Neobacillus notoginsengisoli]|uniref:tRNA(Met) cytidine acetate ligase n=1 Tax=Neobacillus notoginsengisoli TaxID=1578198 RepID=A0A417YRB9_9BACI|nr:nucleotidyltransferase [Neobacillus notoginsengisoli]RHW36518.1 nucleotidyltransferase [Neobacillus notoginsengisoli]